MTRTVNSDSLNCYNLIDGSLHRAIPWHRPDRLATLQPWLVAIVRGLSHRLIDNMLQLGEVLQWSECPWLPGPHWLMVQ